MDNQRLILVIALGFVLFLIWQTWIEEQMAKREAAREAAESEVTETVTATGENTTSADTPVPTGDTVPAAKIQDVPTAATPTQAATTPVVTSDAADRIRILTDEFSAEIDPQGGSLVKVGLLNYPESLDRKDKPFILLNDSSRELFIAQSGLLADKAAPDHKQKFTVEQNEYQLASGQDILEIPLTWSDPTGITVVKTYTFHRGRFDIGVSHKVTNSSSENWTGRQYRQLQRKPPLQSGSLLGGVYTYTGGVISTPEKNYEKVDFDDMAEKDLEQQIPGGWIAMIQHYFLGTWVPDQGETNTIYSKSPGDNRYVLGMFSEPQTIAAGSAGTFNTTLYVGPKIQDKLEALAPHLNRTVDYGWLWFIAEPLFHVLKWIHGYVGNWGWAIIILTVLIKLVFYKLSETSYRSMANMRKLAPQMQKLKDRFGDDRTKLNQAMMEMYKKEKINPLGGCLPILVQIPVFIALYWMLLESVELRQAPWLGWIQDLATKDPYYILPIIMGASMVVQQRLNPTPPDPIQAKVMMVLPIVFTFFFLWFPAGLVLYWVVNNLLSILQQYVITKRVEAGTDKSQDKAKAKA